MFAVGDRTPRGETQAARLHAAESMRRDAEETALKSGAPTYRLSWGEQEEARKKHLQALRIKRLLQVRQQDSERTREQLRRREEAERRHREAIAEELRDAWEEGRLSRVLALERACEVAAANIDQAHRAAWDANAGRARADLARAAETEALRELSSERAAEAIDVLTADARRARAEQEARKARWEATMRAEAERAAEAVRRYREEAERQARLAEEFDKMDKERVERGQFSLRDFKFTRLHELGVPTIVQKHRDAGADGRGGDTRQLAEQEAERAMELDAERARVKAQMGEIAQQRGDAAAFRQRMLQERQAVDAQLRLAADRDRQDALAFAVQQAPVDVREHAKRLERAFEITFLKKPTGPAEVGGRGSHGDSGGGAGGGGRGDNRGAAGGDAAGDEGGGAEGVPPQPRPVQDLPKPMAGGGSAGAELPRESGGGGGVGAAAAQGGPRTTLAWKPKRLIASMGSQPGPGGGRGSGRDAGDTDGGVKAPVMATDQAGRPTGAGEPGSMGQRSEAAERVTGAPAQATADGTAADVDGEHGAGSCDSPGIPGPASVSLALAEPPESFTAPSSCTGPDDGDGGDTGCCDDGRGQVDRSQSHVNLSHVQGDAASSDSLDASIQELLRDAEELRRGAAGGDRRGVRGTAGGLGKGGAGVGVARGRGGRNRAWLDASDALQALEETLSSSSSLSDLSHSLASARGWRMPDALGLSDAAAGLSSTEVSLSMSALGLTSDGRTDSTALGPLTLSTDPSAGIPSRAAQRARRAGASPHHSGGIGLHGSMAEAAPASATGGRSGERGGYGSGGSGGRAGGIAAAGGGPTEGSVATGLSGLSDLLNITGDSSAAGDEGTYPSRGRLWRDESGFVAAALKDTPGAWKVEVGVDAGGVAGAVAASDSASLSSLSLDQSLLQTPSSLYRTAAAQARKAEPRGASAVGLGSGLARPPAQTATALAGALGERLGDSLRQPAGATVRDNGTGAAQGSGHALRTSGTAHVPAQPHGASRAEPPASNGPRAAGAEQDTFAARMAGLAAALQAASTSPGAPTAGAAVAEGHPDGDSQLRLSGVPEDLTVSDLTEMSGPGPKGSEKDVTGMATGAHVCNGPASGHGEDSDGESTRAWLRRVREMMASDSSESSEAGEAGGRGSNSAATGRRAWAAVLRQHGLDVSIASTTSTSSSSGMSAGGAARRPGRDLPGGASAVGPGHFGGRSRGETAGETAQDPVVGAIGLRERSSVPRDAPHVHSATAATSPPGETRTPPAQARGPSASPGSGSARPPSAATRENSPRHSLSTGQSRSPGSAAWTGTSSTPGSSGIKTAQRTATHDIEETSPSHSSHEGKARVDASDGGSDTGLGARGRISEGRISNAESLASDSWEAFAREAKDLRVSWALEEAKAGGFADRLDVSLSMLAEDDSLLRDLALGDDSDALSDVLPAH